MLRLKELRQAKKQNMRQTAIALGIPYTTYISYEKGDREPNLEMLIALAEYFNCSIDYLVGERIAEKEFIASNILEVGKRIKMRREQLGMSQEQLGKALCFNKSTIQRYENGKIASIKVPVINAIAKQLDVNPNWLISGTEDNDEKALQALNASTNKGESEFMRGHTNSVKVAAAIANVLGAALIFRDGKAILEEVESDVHSN